MLLLLSVIVLVLVHAFDKCAHLFRLSLVLRTGTGPMYDPMGGEEL